MASSSYPLTTVPSSSATQPTHRGGEDSVGTNESWKESWKQGDENIEPFSMDSFMMKPTKKKEVKKVVRRRVVVRKDETTGAAAPVLPQPAGDDPLNGIGPHRRVLRRKQNESGGPSANNGSRILSSSATASSSTRKTSAAEDGGEVPRPDLHTVSSDGVQLITDQSAVLPAAGGGRRQTVTVSAEGAAVVMEENEDSNNYDEDEYEYEEYEEVVFLDDSTAPSSCGTSLNFGALKAALNNAYSRRQSLESCVSASMANLEPFMSGEFALLNASGRGGSGVNRSSDTPKHLLATARGELNGSTGGDAVGSSSPKILSPSTSGGSWFRGFRQKVQAIDTKIETSPPLAINPEVAEVKIQNDDSDPQVSPMPTAPTTSLLRQSTTEKSSRETSTDSLFPRLSALPQQQRSNPSQQASTARRRSLQPVEFLPSLPTPSSTPQTARGEIPSSRQGGARPGIPSIYAPAPSATAGRVADDNSDKNINRNRWLAGGKATNGLFGMAPPVYQQQGGGSAATNHLPSLRPHQPPQKAQGPVRPLWR